MFRVSLSKDRGISGPASIFRPLRLVKEFSCCSQFLFAPLVDVKKSAIYFGRLSSETTNLWILAVSAARKKSPRVPFYKPQARILRETRVTRGRLPGHYSTLVKEYDNEPLITT